MIQIFNLWKFFLKVVVVVVDDSSILTNLFVDINFVFVVRARVEIVNVIIFVQIKVKCNYNEKHKSIYMRKKNYALIKLYYNYDIFFTTIFERKYNQQYVDFFRVLKRVDRFVYRFNLFVHWRIHSILFITQLKSTLTSKNDFFQRFKSNYSNWIFVKKNTKRVKFYKIKRFVNKRQTKCCESKYLIR